MFVDTHCHLNFNAYKEDGDAVIRRALDNGITMIIPGAELKSSKRAVEIATRYESGVYAAIGLHPVHLQGQEFEEEGRRVKMKAERFDRDAYERLAQSSKVVAVGEVGVDYHYLPSENVDENKSLQAHTLQAQLQLAFDLDLPAIIHCREAHDDLPVLLQNFYRGKKKRVNGRGVVHDFFGDWDLAWQYFELGFLVSFTGSITFPPKKNLPKTIYDKRDELIRKCPADKFMIETDSPFMAPVPHRGSRNEPLFVRDVAEHIAALKGVSVETVAQHTSENARHLFAL